MQNRIKNSLPKPPFISHLLIVGPPDETGTNPVPTCFFYPDDPKHKEEIEAAFSDNPHWIGRNAIELYIPTTKHCEAAWDNKIILN